MYFKIRNVFSISIVAMMVCQLAVAQEINHGQRERANDPSGLSAEQSGALEEVIVTAQKVSESAQRAPAAVSVILADDLIARGVVDLKAAEVLLPSTKLNVDQNAVQVFIRGIGSQLDNTFIPESVAVNLDGVYLSRFAASGAFYDLQRIEVLPGPQGTLYGRSAVGGVVNVATNRPTQEASTDALVEYGNYSTKHVTLVQNMPLSNLWSVRGAVDYYDNNGYNNNGTYDTDSIAGRLSSLYKSTDFSAFITGSYYVNRAKPSPTQYVPYPNGDAYSFPPTETFTASFYPPNGLPLGESRGKYENSVLAGQFDWNVGPVTVSYLPGAMRSISNDSRPIAGFLGQVQISIDQFSNELRFSGSSADRLTWVGGLYQLWNKSLQYNVFGPNFSGANNRTRADSYAAYGQGTYSITDRARVTVGARLASDTLSADGSEAFFPIPPSFARGTVPFGYDESWKKIGWKVGGEYDIASNSLLYAAIQTGFTPGTYNPSLPNVGSAVNAQTMTGYTVGLKNQFWGGRLRLNLEGFLYDYKDLVVQALDFTTGNLSLLNAPKTQIKGGQLDFVIAPIKELKLHANVGYLDAQFRQFEAGATVATLKDYAGYQLPYSPPYTASLGAEYTLRLDSKGSIGFRVDSYLSSAYWDIFTHTSNLQQEGYTKTDLSLTYYAASSKWDVGLYGKNLENVATQAASGESGRPYPFAGVVYVEPPRLYGIRFHVKIGGG